MIDRIQEHLESIYGIRCEHRASDFLVDGDQARLLGGTALANEELLVAQDERGLEVALFLDPRLLERLAVFQRSPASAIGEDLGDFCEAAEGVSHFVYLTHSADLERSVSLLELEAQAEVDKFALCTLLRWGQGVGRWSSRLASKLFGTVIFRGTLDAAERWRYQEANRMAKAYCERLLPLVSGGSLERLLAELRHGYRLGAQAKLAYFARAR